VHLVWRVPYQEQADSQELGKNITSTQLLWTNPHLPAAD